MVPEDPQKQEGGQAEAMIAGPISLRVVALFLGKKEEAMTSVIKDDHLPVVPIQAGSKTINRVYFGQLLEWINQRAKNSPMTAAQLEAELDRCTHCLALKDADKRSKRAGKESK